MHAITAAQRQYIASVREEVAERKKDGNGPTMTRDEWQQIVDAQASARPQTLHSVA